MRSYLLCLWGLFWLTGCAYYGDIHGSATPLTLSALTKPQVYKSSRLSQQTGNWWHIFHDPELNELISTALKDSPDMQIAGARVRKARHIAESAGASLLPEINASGYVQRQRFSELGLAPPPFNGRIFNIGDVGLNFNYELDFWGKNRQTLAARVSEECAAEGDLAQAALIISAAVANTYFQLLGTIEQLHLSIQYARQTQEISTIVVDRAKNGIESDIPVKTAVANAQTAKLAVEQYKQAEALARNQLAVLLGNNPMATDIITHKLRYQYHPVKLPTQLSANLLARRPDIFAAKSRAQAAAHLINVAKARFFPDINLIGLFSYQSVFLNRLFEPGNQNNAGTVAIDLPIFDAGARRANLGIKYAEYDIAVNEYNQTILNALREVADQIATLRSLRAQLTSQHDVIKATAHNYELFNSRYNHGIVDYVQVLEARELLLQQRTTQIALQTRHLQAVVAMLKALGGNTTQG